MVKGLNAIEGVETLVAPENIRTGQICGQRRGQKYVEKNLNALKGVEALVAPEAYVAHRHLHTAAICVSERE